jgi:hypothetical protein
MSLDNSSQPSVKYCADKLNAKYRPASMRNLPVVPICRS